MTRAAWLGKLVLAAVAFAGWGAAGGARGDEPPAMVKQKRIVTGDPVSMAEPAAQIPELAAPLMQQLAANLELTALGRVGARLSVAPFGFFDRYLPLLSETRLEMHASSDAGPWGLALSLGYNHGLRRLAEQHLDDGARQQAWDGCAGRFDAATLLPAIIDETADIEALLDAADDVALDDGETAAALRWQTLRQLLAAQAEVSDLAKRAARINRLAAEALAAARTRLDAAGLLGAAPSPAAPPAVAAPRRLALKALALAWARLTRAQQPMHAALQTRQQKLGQCFVDALAPLRVQQAFAGAFAVQLRGELEFYPELAGPKAPDDHMVLRGPDPFAGGGLSLHLTHFASSTLRLQLGGTLQWTRDTNGGPFGTTFGAAIDVAAQVARFGGGGEPGSEFTPGIAVGAFLRGERCVSARTCTRNDVWGHGTIPVDMAISGGLYAELRLKPKLQLQIALPISLYTTPNVPAIVQLMPTLSLTAASWSLGG
jgi:hypothetical protein